MTLKSAIDVSAPAYTEAAEEMAAKILELEAEHAKALSGGETSMWPATTPAAR